jgi:hypothetical protein
MGHEQPAHRGRRARRRSRTPAGQNRASFSRRTSSFKQILSTLRMVNRREQAIFLRTEDGVEHEIPCTIELLGWLSESTSRPLS